MEIKKIYEAKTEELIMLSTQRNAEIVFRGNPAYDKVLGVNVTIVNKDTGAAYQGSNVLISIREKGGRSLIAPMPYALLKHANEVKFIDRFIEFDDLKGNGLDTVVTIDASRMSDNITVYATVLYSQAKK